MSYQRNRIREEPVAKSRRTRTQEQFEAEQERLAALQRTARARACRYLMIRGHGCTGRDCAAPEHAEHLGHLRVVLMALQLIPDPEAQWELGPGYGAAHKRKEGAG